MTLHARLLLCCAGLLGGFSHAATSAVSLAPHLLETLSSSTLLSVRLAARVQGADSTFQCLEKIPATVFVPVLDPYLSKNLTADELRTIEAFLQTSAGQKFVKVKQLEQYAAVGEMRPDNYPEFSADEKSALKAFVKTSGGAKFATGDTLLTPELKAALQARIGEVSRQCQAG